MLTSCGEAEAEAAVDMRAEALGREEGGEEVEDTAGEEAEADCEEDKDVIASVVAASMR